MNIEEIKKIYLIEYGEVDSSERLVFRQSSKGNWIVTKWYQRSSWGNEKLVHEITFNPEGKIINIKK